MTVPWSKRAPRTPPATDPPTHSPILLTFPGAEIISFDEAPIAPIRLEDTSHYQITRGILEAPERYWRLLTARRDDEV